MNASAALEGIEQWQYLTFRVAGERYAVPILEVREILPFIGSTNVPMAPAAIRGLINLRGNAVPVADLAVLFRAPATQLSKRTCVVILDVERNGTPMGILAESVELVIELRSEEVEEVPDVAMQANTRFLSGVGRIADAFVPILDVQKMLACLELMSAEDEDAAVHAEA